MSTSPQPATTITDLQREVETLEQRLVDGERRIEEARQLGADVDSWETFWIELLHTYEAVCDRLQAMNAEQDRAVAA